MRMKKELPWHNIACFFGGHSWEKTNWTYDGRAIKRCPYCDSIRYEDGSIIYDLGPKKACKCE